MKIYFRYFKITYILFAIAFLAGCGAIAHNAGDNFYTDIFASGKNPEYKKEGVYNGMDFYVRNPYWKDHYKDPGLLVKNGKVVKPLSSSEVSEISSTLVEQQKQAKVKADKEAEIVRKNNELNAIKNAPAIAAMKKLQEQEISKLRSLNASKSWQVQAAPEPHFGGRGQCFIKEIRNGRTNEDGSVTFDIAYACKMGSAGSSGLGGITCGVGLSNYVKSTSYSARCY